MKSRLSTGQGPAGAGKTATVYRIVRYILLCDIKTLFIAASNKAVDVMARTFLEQARAANESTKNVFRIKFDLLEKMTAEPDIRETQER